MTPERFEAILDKVDLRPDGCWGWGTQWADRHSVVVVDHVSYKAHRLIWSILVGPIPEGREFHHKCGRKACCNVAHLEIVTRAQHSRREGHRSLPAVWARRRERPTCHRGHALAVQPSGRRVCLTCKREAQRRRRAGAQP